MKTLYHVEGQLCKDFIGQISYTICLTETYRELDIEFSFSPQHYSKKDVTWQLKKQLTAFCKNPSLGFNTPNFGIIKFGM